MNDILFIENLVDRATVKIIREKVLVSSGWTIVFAHKTPDNFQNSFNKIDSGLILSSFNQNSKHDLANTEPTKSEQKLNFFGDLVLSLLEQQALVSNTTTNYPMFKNCTPRRYFWNFYHSNSEGIYHTDTDDSNYYSCVLYLNTAAECGTAVINSSTNEEEIFLQKEGNAVIFPSNYNHKGIAPQNNDYRLNLNIIFSADTLRI